jgi:hypothetical protein
MKYLLLIAVLTIINLVKAETVAIGQTYPIAEPDALLQIQSQVNKVDWQDKAKSATKSALKGIQLPIATDNLTREYIPYYTLPFDITDDKGKLIYAAGYKYNPLDYISLPMRVIVFTPTMTLWVSQHKQPNDILILAYGDTIQASKDLQTTVYLLDKVTVNRLDIKLVPSIITRDNNKLIIQEYDYPRWEVEHGL